MQYFGSKINKMKEKSPLRPWNHSFKRSKSAEDTEKTKCSRISAWQQKYHSPMCGSKGARYLFVALAPCTTLRWRSAVRFITDSLYKHLQLPSGEEHGPKYSVHLDSFNPATKRKFNLYADFKNCFFPYCLKLAQLRACKRQQHFSSSDGAAGWSVCIGIYLTFTTF